MRRSGLISALNFRLVDTRWGFFGVVFAADGRMVATFLPQPEKALRRIIAARFPSAQERASGATEFCRQVRAYFSGQRVAFRVKLALDDFGQFRRSVLEACRRIPYGATASYADLARAAGSPAAARAVGGTMANNPLPLIIPCHRVLHSDGSLGGFSSPEGCTQKIRLLKLENPSFRPT